jgi:CheY-specific phosphatase CheX
VPALASNRLRLTLDSFARHTCAYFGGHLSIPLGDPRLEADLNGAIDLRELTALLAVGGTVSLLVALSTDLALAEEIQRKETQGLNIPTHEMPPYLGATLCEVLNIIAGHCTADLAESGRIVTLSPPVLIESPRLLPRPEQTSLGRASFNTPWGPLDILCAAPRERFPADIQSMGTSPSVGAHL